ncbi:MAG TPA: galactokinase family protein [Euzebya sp.]|nr:galactokinase family protein [Euzebya sp.]
MYDVHAWAPGRVNLIGEHTDHTDGLALPMAIQQGVGVEGTPADRIRLRSTSQLGVVVDVAADGSHVPADGWGRYVAAIAAELGRLGRPPVGLDAEVTSTLQAGIGLSSSAALEVSLAVALLRAAVAVEGARAPLDVRQLALACRRAEHRAVGVPSGVLDQAASLLGRAGAAVVLDCADLSWAAAPIPPATTVVIIDSGVRRQLESSGYAQRTEELGAALHVLGGRRPAEVDPAELDGLLADLPAVPARRLRHVVTENARVRATVTAFASDDRDAIGRLFAASHASLREDFEVTVPETDALVELLVAEGAIGARMTGGGFGGAVIALAAVDGAQAVADRVVRRYRNHFPDRRPVTLVSAPADGAAARAPDVVASADAPPTPRPDQTRQDDGTTPPCWR